MLTSRRISIGALVFGSLLTGLSFIFIPAEAAPVFCLSLAMLPFISWLLIFRRDLFFPSLIFLVPLSLNLAIGDDSKADLPSEPLLGLMTLFFSISLLVNYKPDKKIIFHPVSLLLFFELTWMIVCSFHSEMPVVSFKRCIVRYSFIMVFYLLFSGWIKNTFSAGKIFIVYAAGCVIPIIHGFIFHAKYHFSSVTAYLMPRPFFAEHTIYGACLAFLIPMLVILVFNASDFGIKGGKLFGLWMLSLLVICAEFLSFSRAAWISLGVAFLLRILIFFRIRWWMLMLLLLTGGMVAWQNSALILETIKRNDAVSNKGGISEHLMSVTNLQSDASNLERINRWKCAIRMALEKPLTGFGPGTYQFVYGRFQSRADLTRISTFRGTNGHAHSEFFNALSETGIPGAAFYLILVLTMISYGLKIIYRAVKKEERAMAMGAFLGLITFYVHGFFNAFLDSDKMGALVFGSMAVLVWLDVQQRKTLKTSADE
jgi:O-antigen ligase